MCDCYISLSLHKTTVISLLTTQQQSFDFSTHLRLEGARIQRGGGEGSSSPRKSRNQGSFSDRGSASMAPPSPPPNPGSAAAAAASVAGPL